ncbi:MAG: hypothetical protein HY866_07485 [Chloroflexi bacterium]|nr:hypothetical protein [Chloroflexota bacterium]
MLSFTTSTEQDFADFGRQLWLTRNSFLSHEQASQSIVRQLSEAFIDKNGESQIALARIFRLTEVEELPADVRGQVKPGEQKVMALTGTWGLEKAWQHRSRSKGHQAIPISAIAVPERIPMFQEVLTQLGIDIEYFYNTNELVARGDQPYQGTFHIADATSSAIPAQADFIRPYGIRSLVGFGGFIGSAGVLYLLYIFSREYISPAAARNFYGLQEFIGASIAIESRIFEN